MFVHLSLYLLMIVNKDFNSTLWKPSSGIQKQRKTATFVELAFFKRIEEFIESHLQPWFEKWNPFESRKDIRDLVFL